MEDIIHIEALRTSDDKDVYVNVNGLICLLKDVKKHPNKYNKEIIKKLMEELMYGN
jgi:hypothetical protein